MKTWTLKEKRKMDDKAVMTAIDQLKQGIDALAAAVGGDSGGDVAGASPEIPEGGPDEPVNPDAAGDAAGAEVPAPARPGMTAMSPEDFINKKAGQR
jgi:hypothetical protein